jgi:hypothetical protein
MTLIDNDDGRDSNLDIQGDDSHGQTGDHAAGDNQNQTVPKWRLDQVLGQLRSERDKSGQLEDRIAKLETAASQPQTHQYTATELDAFVNEGRISQTQASEILLKQAEQRTEARIESEVSSRTAAIARDSTLGTEMSAYVDKVPDLQDTSSEVFGRVQQEFNYLTGTLGMPSDSIETQLAAVRGVLGPVNSIGANQPSTRRVETHQETGGAGAGDEDNAFSGDLQWSDLSAGQRAYYDNEIRNGTYKDREEVLKLEGQYGNSELRKRHGARK